MLSTLLRPNRF